MLSVSCNFNATIKFTSLYTTLFFLLSPFAFYWPEIQFWWQPHKMCHTFFALLMFWYLTPMTSSWQNIVSYVNNFIAFPCFYIFFISILAYVYMFCFYNYIPNWNFCNLWLWTMYFWLLLLFLVLKDCNLYIKW